MKKVIVPADKGTKINWYKPQWVINDLGIVVLTTGRHEQEGEGFSGTCLPCDEYPNGNYSTGWKKSGFKPLTYDIPFTISNSED